MPPARCTRRGSCLGGLIVDPARMAKNLGMTHGLIVAEAVMMGLAPVIGRNEAHDLVYDACRAAIESDRRSTDVLLETPAVAGPLGAETLRALTARPTTSAPPRRWSTTSSPPAERASRSEFRAAEGAIPTDTGFRAQKF